MLNVDSLMDGIVIDHINAGKGMEIYHYLRLDEYGGSVAIIKNARSSKMGKKDIIKIESAENINFDVLGFIDPNVTVSVIHEGKLVRKFRMDPPDKLVNIVRCKNPRCITSVEPGIDQIFVLTDRSANTYRCAYCEQEYRSKE